MSGLGELRVLELGTGVSASYAAKLLADHGADVVKLEPPTGDGARRRGPFPGDVVDAEKSGLFLALNTNKRGVCVDLDAAKGPGELEGLVAWADLLIQDFGRGRAAQFGLDAASLEQRRPDLVTLSITPFGSSGPYADFRAEELTLANAGGWASPCPAATQRPDLPPLKVFGHQCGFMAGVAGATAALAARFSAERTGVGEFIDFSVQAYIASVLENAIPQFSYAGRVATRYGTRLIIPWGIFECRDGPLFLVCVEQDQWERLVALMGSPDWASLEVFETLLGRAQNQDILHTFVQEWLAEKSAFEIYHEMQRHRICAAPVLDLKQMAESEHLNAREFFCDVAHPRAGRIRQLAPPARTREGRLPARRGAPLLGQHDGELLGGKLDARSRAIAPGTASLPLDGIRVADLSWAWAGPFCGSSASLPRRSASSATTRCCIEPRLTAQGRLHRLSRCTA